MLKPPTTTAGFLPLRTALTLLRDETSEDVSIQTIVIFLTVADRPGITGGDIQQLLGIAKSTVSRNVMYLLKKRHGRDGQGYGLIDMIEDDRDRRKKSLFLTAEGQKLASRVKEIFQ